jgi:putative DNA primase/helicase
VLFVAVLLDAFRSGKYPILNLVGEFGTAKSTLAKMFKQLVDPDETELRSLPGNLHDVFIAVHNARVRAWDNVSKIERTISDALCQLSDGSGFGTRKLYTDDDEFRIQGSRSIILTGLTNCATRPDLSSRTVMLMLQPIRDDARKSEVELWARFNEAYP